MINFYFVSGVTTARPTEATTVSTTVSTTTPPTPIYGRFLLLMAQKTIQFDTLTGREGRAKF